VAYADVNGTRLCYEERGDGPPVVFGHSALQDARQWEPQMAAFADRHRAVRYDMRWFGRSDRTPGRFSERDDLRALLDHLGIERAALVGSSYGGRVYLEVALESPERVAALVLVCSGLPGPSADTPEQQAAVETAIEAGELERFDGDLRVLPEPSGIWIDAKRENGTYDCFFLPESMLRAVLAVPNRLRFQALMLILHLGKEA